MEETPMTDKEAPMENRKIVKIDDEYHFTGDPYDEERLLSMNREDGKVYVQIKRFAEVKFFRTPDMFNSKEESITHVIREGDAQEFEVKPDGKLKYFIQSLCNRE